MKNNLIRGAAALCLAVALAPARADLTLDGTFGGGDGLTEINVAANQDAAADLAVQADGKYVSVGISRQTVGSDDITYLLVTRHNPDGTLDTGFDGDGVLTLLPGGTPQDTGGATGLAVAIQGDDQKILVAGSWNQGDGSGNRILVVRLNTDGSLDDDADADPGVVFGNGGVLIINQANLSPGFGDGITVQPDGRILVVGVGGTGNQAYILRLLADGSFDTGFADNGTFFLQGGSLRLSEVAVQTDNKIVAAGGPFDLIATRVTADGDPDTTFGTGGVVQINFFNDFNGSITPSSNEDVRGLAIQPDGKILLAGVISRQINDPDADADPMLVRLNADGSRDFSFGAGGLALFPEVGGGEESGYDLVLRPFGDIVVAGQNFPPTQVSADGTAFQPLAGFTNTLFALAVLGDGTVVGAGERTLTAPDTELLVARFSVTDLPDPPTDTVPDPFEFQDVVGQPRDTLVVSDTLTITGIDAPTPVQVLEGEYSIGCDPDGFTGAPGTINNNETICVRNTSSNQFFIVTPTILVIGGYVDIWLEVTEGPDTAPDPLNFPTKTDVPANTLVESDPVTITGINTPVEVKSITNGQYSVNCTGTWTSTPGEELVLNDTLCVRHTSAATSSASVVTSITVGFLTGFPNSGQTTGTFTSVVAGPDAVPDPFTFTDQTGVGLGVTVTSAPVTINGIAVAAQVSVTGSPGSNSAYSVGCTGTYTTNPGTVNNGQQICVRHLSAATGETAVDTVLTVGGISDTFTSTTRVADTAPDPFSFADQTGVPLSQLIVSSVITVTGIEAPASISITGGEWSPGCSGSFTALSSTVPNNTQICVRHVSANVGLTDVNTVLTIGGVSDTFTSTTLDVDAVPDAFSFTDQTNVALSSTVTSAPVTITGINTAVPVFVSGGTFAIGCTGTYGTSGTISSGQTVCVRHTASALSNSVTSTTLTIGGVSDVFTSTTVTVDQVPDAFSFAPVTNVDLQTLVDSAPATITGIDSPTPVSVTGGAYSVGCTDTYTTLAGTISSGQQVCVRVLSASSQLSNVTAVLTVGGVTGNFVVTTGETVPDAFSFEDRVDVPLTTTIVSAPVTITGITARARITIQQGEYSVGCTGNWTAEAGGLIANGETLCVRHVSSFQRENSINTVVTVGGVSDTFTSTTTADKPLPGVSGFDGLSLLLLSPVLWRLRRRGGLGARP